MLEMLQGKEGGFWLTGIPPLETHALSSALLLTLPSAAHPKQQRIAHKCLARFETLTGAGVSQEELCSALLCRLSEAPTYACKQNIQYLTRYLPFFNIIGI